MTYSTEQEQTIKKNKQLVEECIKKHSLEANPYIDDELLLYEHFPKSVSIKLAVLILAYKREASTQALTSVSTQPAGIIRNLRKIGFIFQQDGNSYEYKNEQGERVRKIIGIAEIPNEDDELKGEEITSIDSLEISHFFCIKDLTIKNLKDKKEIYILGENGDGKSLILQAIVLGLKGYFIQNIADIEPYIGAAMQLIRDSKLSVKIVSDTGKRFSVDKSDFAENIFAYGVYRGRKNLKNNDLYGFATLFSDDIYLREPTDWLLEVERFNLKKIPSIQVEEAISMLEELLDGNVKIALGKDIVFTERGTPIGFNQLSEGYKSIITWVVDLLSRLTESQPKISTIQDFKGVVIVDEVSLHLHPKWEYVIVKKLRTWFPKLQFIFTTHSPISVLGASEDAIFYRIYKEEGITQIAEPFYASEIKNWMSNILITSPLFDLQTARMRTFEETTKEQSDTSVDFMSHIIHKEISEEVKKIKKQGTPYLSPNDISEMVKQAIEKNKVK